MVITLRVPSWRALGLMLSGAVLGATLVAPVVARDGSPAAVEPTAIQTRAVSCQGLNWYPTDSATGYTNIGAARVRTGGGTGDFRCDPGLPHRAVVAKVQFTVFDDDEDGEVSGCNLKRAGLTPTTAVSHQWLASVPATGVTATPGTVRSVDSSIDFATIDNVRFGYWLECHIGVFGSSGTAIYGASITYTIDSANG